MLKFIDEVIRKSGLNLPDDFINDFKERMLSNLQKKIWFVMINALNDAKLKKFIQLFGEISDPEDIGAEKKNDILNFFRTNVKDLDATVLKTMDEFGKEFVSDVSALTTD